MFKKYSLVFLTALGLNIIWEFAHSVLYLNYRGGPITSFILLRAAFWDALIILGLVLFAQKYPKMKYFTLICGGLIIGVGIELFALKTGRWQYAPNMPLIPIFNTGLSPSVQLAAGAILVFWLVYNWKYA